MQPLAHVSSKFSKNKLLTTVLRKSAMSQNADLIVDENQLSEQRLQELHVIPVVRDIASTMLKDYQDDEKSRSPNDTIKSKTMANDEKLTPY